jgi:integrase
MQHTDLILNSNSRIDRMVKVNGVDFEEQFLADLIAKHMSNTTQVVRPTVTTAYEIYSKESPAANQIKFQLDLARYYQYFVEVFGDMPLDELRHWHIVQYRDIKLKQGLKTSTVRKHVGGLNAMLNMAFKHLDIDRLSPFRGLRIPNEGYDKKQLITVTTELIHKVKHSLIGFHAPHRLVALVQLNTGMRLSEPVFARLDDCVLDHEIPHLWVRPNELSQRKTKSSVRAVPLHGASLDAAKILYRYAKEKNSQWLVPHYARYKGNNSCSAAIHKTLEAFEFHSHLFRHAFIESM